MQARNYNFHEQQGLFPVLRSFDIHKELHKLTFPVFLISCAQDRIIRPEETRELRECLASDKYTRDEARILFCGHSPMVERSSEFMQALSGYLGRLNFQQVVHPSITEVRTAPVKPGATVR
jgi:pimeloyl-ACP methyl ester carboxylesterase